MKEEYTTGLTASTPQDSNCLNATTDIQPQKSILVTGVEASKELWERVSVKKIILFFFSLFLFILAINLIKDGARGLSPLVRSGQSITNMAYSLGFGWLFAYILMSGSPVAATALALFDAGSIDKLSTFSMITGSRLGAGFIVLFIGLLYVLRGRDRRTSLSMGLLSLIVTATTYLPGLVIGTLLLRARTLDGVQIRSGALLESFVDRIYDPIIDLITGVAPDWTVFLFGIIIILISLHLFDKCLPQMTIKESRVGWMSRLVYKPFVMFLLGAAVTMVSMSVSISLGILVPLSNRGFVRRENVAPYIMGANITTFTDTLLASLLLNNPSAFTIVFVEMISITIISLILLSVSFSQYNRHLLSFVDIITESNRNMIIFFAVIFLVPIFLIMV
jgi:hypothetical protein